MHEYFNIDQASIEILLKFNLLTYKAIYLNKSSNNTSISFFPNNNRVNFKDLSSGQQAVLNTLLGISSVINDNSLICIDEPEISLHPEWQEDIIKQLQYVFQHIKGCHFLIATHSPQVVSGLKSTNGFIINLATLETYKSDELNMKSADYQLATLFDTPGYNNEYLIRISLVILAKITKGEAFDNHDLTNITLLKTIRNHIPENDSVGYLIDQVTLLVDQ